MKWTIFFDLDGTTIDTSERHYRVYRDILDSYGIQNTISKDEFRNMKGMGRKTVELLPNGCSKSFIQKFEKEWINKIEKKENLKYDFLIPHVSDVLSILRDGKNKLILVTLRNNKENLFWELNNLKLTKYFEEVLVGSPLRFEEKSTLIREYLKTAGKDRFITIIGDSEADITAAKKSGILSVAVTYGIRSEDFLHKLKPDFCLDSLCGLLQILKENGDGL